MKANELMIGDWVCYDGDTDYSCPVKIEGMDVSCDFCITSDRDDTGFNGVIPIPLTAEILEKNGFVNDSSYDECVADGHFITIQIWSYNTENVLIQWDGITCEVINDFGNPCEKITLHGENYEHDIYAHELQHALRLCGLNDLADNFKV